MAYTVENFKSKAAIKRAIAEGKAVRVFQPGGLSTPPMDGSVTLEGPHYPQPHSWWGTGTLKNGVLVNIK